MSFEATSFEATMSFEETKTWHGPEGSLTIIRKMTPDGLEVTTLRSDGSTTSTFTTNPDYACMGEQVQIQHEQNKHDARIRRRREVEQAEAKYQMQRQYAKSLGDSKSVRQYANQLKEKARKKRHEEEKAARRREETARQESRRERDAQEKVVRAMRKIQKKMNGSW